MNNQHGLSDRFGHCGGSTPLQAACHGGNNGEEVDSRESRLMTGYRLLRKL